MMIGTQKLNKKFKDIGKDLPIGESLKNVIDRLKPFGMNMLTILLPVEIVNSL